MKLFKYVWLAFFLLASLALFAFAIPTGAISVIDGPSTGDLAVLLYVLSTLSFIAAFAGFFIIGNMCDREVSKRLPLERYLNEEAIGTEVASSSKHRSIAA